jgi:hypothetical protein
MVKKLLSIAVALPLALSGGVRLAAETEANGTDPRPFYIMAHNPNTLEAVTIALANHANALEPDIIELAANAIGPGGAALPGGMVMYHDPVLTPARVPLTLEQYLDGVHDLAKQFPNLALIEFDVKPQAAHHENGPKILDAVHNHLNYDGVNLNVIISVGNRDPDGDLFRDIYGLLGEREGLQVDAEDRADLVVDFLKNTAYGNISYGDGTITTGPHLPRATDLGSFLKASWGFPRIVSDIYSIELEDSMSFFIDAGADGIIPDHFPLIPPSLGLGLTEFDGLSMDWLNKLYNVVQQHKEIRLATREDNPFKPALQSYGLEMTTMNTGNGGTNATLTFTLNGCRGSSTLTYNTGMVTGLYSTGRMESGQTDFATIPSLNLGKLTSVDIYNDGTGLGGAPDWDLGEIRASSARWLGTNIGHAFEYLGIWNATVAATKTVHVPLAAQFQEPEPTIECPAPITVNNAPGQCSAVVNFAPKVDGMCNDVTASSDPASGTAFAVGIKDVVSTASSPTFPQSHPMCTFTVTIKDVEAPTIACPAPMSIDATGPQGAVATFAPVAGDNCSATVSSVPASGSLFAIGTTPVSSTAQDPSGNQSSCSFTVHVKGAAEQLADLVTAVTNLPVNQGIQTSLLAKLNAALAKVQGSQAGPACSDLSAFISQVSAQSGKAIAAADADALIAKATQIRAVLGC